MRKRLGILPLVLLITLVWRVPTASAAAEFHRFNVVLSAVPTQIRATDFNDLIEVTNRTQLVSRGLAPLDKITLSWLLDVEMRYFVRQNLAVSMGVGRLKKVSSQEYLPAIAQSIVLAASISSVPLHAGAAYYFKPYNQGDFQARAYVGAGFMSLVNSRASLSVSATGIDLGPAGGIGVGATNDGPGYYGELGAHLFFATRYSVQLSGLYRSTEARNLVDERTRVPLRDARGRPIGLDVGGAGFRMALGIGL